MTTFTDDFNRADGPVGNGWTCTGANVNIASNVAVPVSAARMHREPWTHTDWLRARLLSDRTGGSNTYARPIVRCNGDATNYYYLLFQYGTTVNTVQIWKRTGGTDTRLDHQTYATDGLKAYTLELWDNNGSLVAYVDGVQRATASDTDHHANTECGVVFPDSRGRADDFYADDVGAAALDVQPDEYSQTGVDPHLTFTGTGTSWTPGTPGSPTFTVDKGSLHNQTVIDATHAEADYTLPVQQDTATFTDPSTSEQDTLPLVNGFVVDTGASGSADTYFDAMDAGGIGVTDWVDLLLKLLELMGVNPEGSDTLTLIWEGDATHTGVRDLLDKIKYAWESITPWIDDPAEPPVSLRDWLDDVRSETWALDGALKTVEDWVCGGSQRTTQPTFATTLALIDLATANTEDSLAALRTNENLTLTSVTDTVDTYTDTRLGTTDALAQRAADVRTVEDYHLGHVLAWIGAVQGEGLPTIADVLDAIENIPALDLSEVLTAIGGVNTNVDAAETAILSAIAAIPALDLTAVLDAIGTHDGNLTTARGDILAAISAIPTVDLSGIESSLSNLDSDLYADYLSLLAAIQAIPTNPVTSLQPVLDAVGNLDDDLVSARAAILAAIAAIPALDLSAVLTVLGTPETTIAGDIAASESAITSAISTATSTIVGAVESARDAILAALTPVRGAPIWPGEASVTLGTPVALAGTVSIDTPMDGVVVNVTTPPTKLGVLMVGDQPFDYRVGQITFLSDSGDAEGWQYLGFRQAIYTPRSLARAAGVRLTVHGGALGTVTPWVIGT